MKERKEKEQADKFVTIQHVAEKLSCTDKHVCNLLQSGILTGIKIGPRAIRISLRSLEEFISANTIDPDDYFAPGDEQESAETRPAKVIRSSWMNR